MLSTRQYLTIHFKPYIEHLVAGRADEQPPRDITFPLEHAVETVLVTAIGTDFKFLASAHLMYFVIHLTDLQIKTSNSGK